MNKSRFHFSHFTNYLLYAFIIIILFSCFGYASFLSNEIATFILAFPIAATATGYIFYIIYNKEKKTRSYFIFFIFIISYLIALISIHITSLLPSVFWFASEYLLLALFSFTWLIFKLITDIKEDHKDKDIYYSTTVFLPFMIAIIYTGMFMTLVIPKQTTKTDNLRDRGLAIFNKIYNEIDSQLQIEGYNIVKLSYIGFNENEDVLRVGCFSTLNAYTYNVFEYNYTGLNSANEVFEKIEKDAHFPSYNRMFYNVDEINSYVQTKPSVFDEYETYEHYSVNYKQGDKFMVDTIMRVKKDNVISYATVECDYSTSIINSHYIYEGLGNYVVGLI